MSGNASKRENGKEKSSMKKDENEEEEDVPEDFFDDFSNQDFMAGLDVVDAWDDDDEADKKEGSAGKKNKQQKDNRNSVKNNDKDKDKEKSLNRSRNSDDRKRRSSRERRNYRSRAASRERRSEDRLRRAGSKELRNIREERRRQDRSADRRRDPEKTKRDIQKDKDRRIKDEEAKIISEKLKVVETGLVPPGMEMDIDLNTVKSVIAEAKEEQKKSRISPIVFSPERKPSADNVGSKSFPRERYFPGRPSAEQFTSELPRPHSRSKSIDYRRLAFSPPLGYNAFHEKKAASHRSPPRSPRRVVRSRSRSPRRSPFRGRQSHSRSYRRSRSPDYPRKRSSYHRTKSPSLERKRRRSYNRSPHSDVSDRERWLRKRGSLSPHSRYKQRELLDEMEQKYKNDRGDERKSPLPDLSERDKWLRNRPHSPVSLRRHREFLEDLDRKLKKEKSKEKRKKDFLKEIHKKLNETSRKENQNVSVVQYPGFPAPMQMGPIQAGPMPNVLVPGSGPQGYMPASNLGPVPHPVQPGPIPMQIPNLVSGPMPIQGPGANFVQGPRSMQAPFNPAFGPGPTSNSMGDARPVPAPFGSEDCQYNEQFFIGQPASSHAMNGPYSPNVQNLSMQTQQKGDEPSRKVDVKNKETVKKLFEEKKISLADYLSLTAMETDLSKPVNIQHKIQVISRCQDAIKALDGAAALDGRFFLRKNKCKQPEKPTDLKGQSPLRKIPIVRFQFTTPTKGNDEKPPFSRIIDKLLAGLGLSNSITRDVQSPQPTTQKPVPVESNLSTLPSTVKSSFVKAKSVRAQDFMIEVKKQQNKLCQTDSSLMKCKICEIRFARTFVSVGSQCDEKEMVDMGTQCIEEKPQETLKKQSLAHLTPAQILKQITDKGNKNDAVFPGAKQMMNPPPAPSITPDKKLGGISNNDSFPRNKLEQARNRLANERFTSPADRDNIYEQQQRFEQPQPPSFDNRAQPLLDNRIQNFENRSLSFERTPSFSRPQFDRPQTFDREQPFDRTQQFDRSQAFDRPQHFDDPNSFDRTQQFDRPQQFDRSLPFERSQMYDRPQTFDRSQPFDRPQSFDRHQQFDRQPFDRLQPERPQPPFDRGQPFDNRPGIPSLLNMNRSNFF